MAFKDSAVFNAFSFLFQETGMQLPSKMDESDIDSIGAMGGTRKVCNTCISAPMGSHSADLVT